MHTNYIIQCLLWFLKGRGHLIQSRSLLIFLLFLSFLWLSSLPTVSGAAYNAYHYDLTTPQFTPDGRLLQVEYASAAAQRSAPLVILQIHRQTSSNDDGDNGEDVLTIVATTKASRKSQDRILTITHNPNHENYKMRRPSPLICGLSGVLGDAMALLHKAFEEQDTHQRWYGRSTLTAQQFAVAIGNACQNHSFGGGLRPYGATMVVLGQSSNKNKEYQVQIFETHPSGSVQELSHILAVSQQPVLVGGTKTAQDRIRQQLMEQRETATTVADLLPRLARVLLEERSDEAGAAKTKDMDSSNNASLEITILSRRHGVRRLTEEQIEKLVQRAKEKP
jgi:20S proteasome alpha/beta subunit